MIQPVAVRRQPLGPAVFACALLLAAALAATIASAARAQGEPDPGFGEDGIATGAFNFGTGQIKDLSVTPAGKILVVGTTGDLLAARFDPDGSLDPTFGLGGRLAPVNFTGCRERCPRELSAIAQQHGSTLVAGFTDWVSFVTRIGATDWGKGSQYGDDQAQGVPYAGVSSEARVKDVAAAHDGSLVVVGYQERGKRDPEAGVAYRLDRGGRLDLDYGNDYRRFKLSLRGAAFRNARSTLNGVAAVDGGAVLVGTVTAGGSRRMAVVKLDERGRPDARFGATDIGVSLLGRGTAGEDVAVSARTGAVYAAGRRSDPRGRQHAFLVKLNPDGYLSRGFARKGIFVSRRAGTSATAVALSQGRIVLGGGRSSGRGEKALQVTRLRLTGRLDRSFGTGGVFSTRERGAAYANAVAIDGSGRVLVGGRAASPLGPLPLLMRLEG